MRDGYVGAVKGVISRISPAATIVDIAHDVPRGDIAHAAWVVATSALEFPHRTIHVVVVDPGVGGARAGIVARIDAQPPRGEQYFVGPDNGVFAYLKLDRVHRIENADAVAHRVSPTFHGRDVFAYVAAALASDRPLSYFGKRTTPEGILPWGERAPGKGRVVHVDQYGNLITDLPAEETPAGVFAGGRHLALVGTYEDAPVGELLAYVGSASTIELAVRDGRADRVLPLQRGDIIEAAPPGARPAPGPYR